MNTPTTPHEGSGAGQAMSAEELAKHALGIGTRADLITIREDTHPDLVSIIVRKPDGRSVRRSVPRESWIESSYRSSLIQAMGMLLA